MNRAAQNVLLGIMMLVIFAAVLATVIAIATNNDPAPPDEFIRKDDVEMMLDGFPYVCDFVVEVGGTNDTAVCTREMP